MTDTNKFFKSAFSVDNVIFGFDESNLKVLLIKRGEAPFAGKWALPGDLVYPNEDLDTAAGRVLEELAGLKNVYLEQVHTFGAVNRHPLGRVITIAYFSLVKISAYNPISSSTMAQSVHWMSVETVQKAKDLAFDHNDIFHSCFQRLQRQVRSRPIGFELLPPKFTLTELQHLYESVLQTELDKRNFRKKILSMDILVDLKEMQAGVAHRPAKLYKFDQDKYNKAVDQGMSFELKESKPKKEGEKKNQVLASHF
jgi:8-oxo-dGTP diphosphatase